MIPWLTRVAAIALVTGIAGQAPGFDGEPGELVLLPSTLTLRGPDAAHQTIVEVMDGKTARGDLTRQAQFRIDDEHVALVSAGGVVTPVGDGITTLTATVGDRSVTAEVRVEGFHSASSWSFRNHVLPVMTKVGCNSGACHGAEAGKGGLKLSLRGYDPERDHDVLTRQAQGRRIMKTAPAESLMLIKPTGAIEHGGGRLLETVSREYQVLSGWIATGTAPPSTDDAELVSITALPTAVTLKPGTEQSVLVQAHYTDGRVEDVTRWTKFAVTDESVARVDDNGLVSVRGHGEAAVTVWFNNLVQIVTITSPYETPIDPRVFAEAPRFNPVDDLNLSRLAGLGIPPSPTSDDTTFLRRAYLDATGTLPSTEAVGEFMADTSRDKREKLVDRLLGSPEYIDYWTYKWSDLLLVSSKDLPAPAMWAFYRFIRESVEHNIPWDEFARRILTAKGSTLTDGAANYFVLHRDTIELTENATVAFLGLAMTCARCHNHPMEKWTQDEYYGLANLFSRVKLKDGEATGDVIVTPTVEGEILHPRRGIAMPPQPLDGEALDLDDRGDRRAHFAAWLSDRANPYFDRAIVTRIWAGFFGAGLIDPPDDLRATNPPSDAALLDWLVEDFRTHGRDLRRLMRLIMTSATYQRSSEPVPGNELDLKYLSHYPARRLSAEVLLDAITQVTGAPTKFEGYPEGWRSLQLPDAKVASPFLDAFGRAPRETTCSCERSDAPSMAQALHLANGETLNEKLRAEGGVVTRLASAGVDDTTVLETLFRSALSRDPTPAEIQGFGAALGDVSRSSEGPEPTAERRQVIEDLLWAILTSNEFLFNH